jgi:hypothetical protein
MGCSKFNSHVYKLKRCNKWEYICFYFATGGLKRPLPLGSASMSKKIDDGPMNMWIFQKEKKKEVIITPIN